MAVQKKGKGGEFMPGTGVRAGPRAGNRTT